MASNFGGEEIYRECGMLKSHERFHSANGKRLILVADDEFINREVLRAVLMADYELEFAENGEVALAKMRENSDTLSLVLLDLQMPMMSGIEVLREAKADPQISQIPILVVTADQKAEVECLTLGAADFVPKPYPDPDVILARVLKTIELSEDRQIIRQTERDALTGLYNREYFYRYAEQYDQFHKESGMDAIVVDVNHFHMINERFGNAHGDAVLKLIGQSLVSQVNGLGGIVCRRESDIFLVYCPHGLDYAELLERTTAHSSQLDGKDTHIWLRMGVYANVDKSLDVVRRFDRAKMASDTVRGSFTTQIGYYDKELHEREIYEERLIEGFDEAIREHQFTVHFQPKFDIQPEIPVLASAEALVRWNHPEMGMIVPGIFIPLFEENGLIQTLDLYVWRETAARIREWHDRFGFAVPVSVNVSRIDMYDPHLVETLLEVLAENDLAPADLLLEITESAYTQDSDQIIATVNKLRRLGFNVEMDDFGTGYSSLNMISTLPIDALKMDMQFIRTAFSEDGDTKMLEVVIDIADYLSIPVIAEGVETEDQMLALRDMGCDYVQGYYFSRPVPADEYERFLIERKEVAGTEAVQRLVPPTYATGYGKRPFEYITQALSSAYECICYVDADTDHYVEFGPEGKRDDLQIEGSGADFFGEPLQRMLGSVHPEDAMRVDLSLRKEALLSQLALTMPFYLTYRVMGPDGPVFYSLEATRPRNREGNHVVLGVRNVDAQIREADAERRMLGLNYASFAQALASDATRVFHVDADSGSYVEFEADGFRQEVSRVSDGADFFTERAGRLLKGVAAESRDAVAAFLGREGLVDALSKNMAALMRYRASDGGFCRMKAVWADGESRRHIVVGISREGAPTR